MRPTCGPLSAPSPRELADIIGTLADSMTDRHADDPIHIFHNVVPQDASDTSEHEQSPPAPPPRGGFRATRSSSRLLPCPNRLCTCGTRGATMMLWRTRMTEGAALALARV